MDLPKFMQLVAEIIADETKPPGQTEILVCMHCRHVLRIDGEQCSTSIFVPKQMLEPLSMKTYYTPWKYRCGGCGKWGFEFDIDEVLPQNDSTN